MLIALEVKIEMPIIQFVVSLFEELEKVSDVVYGECGLAKDAYNLNDGSANFEIMLDDGNEPIGDNGNVYLDSDGIWGLVQKSLEQLNPLEEKFDQPSVLVQECNILGQKVEVVIIIRDFSVKVLCIVNNASDRKGVALLVPLSCETDNLVSQDNVLLVKQVISRLDNVFRTELFTYDEEYPLLLNSEESGEVKVASVKHIASKTLVREPLYCIDIMQPCGSNYVGNGYSRDDVNLCMNLEAEFGTSKFWPTEYEQAKIDDGRVYRVESTLQFKLLGDAFGLGNGDNVKGKFLKDVIISKSSGFRQHLPVDWLMARVEEVVFFTVSNCNICKFSETSIVHKLTKHQNQQMITMRQRPALGTVVMLDNYAPEPSLEKKLSYMYKNVCSNVHICSDFELDTKVYISRIEQSIRGLKRCA